MNTVLNSIMNGKTEDYLIYDPEYYVHKTAQIDLKGLQRIDFSRKTNKFNPDQDYIDRAKEEYYRMQEKIKQLTEK